MRERSQVLPDLLHGMKGPGKQQTDSEALHGIDKAASYRKQVPKALGKGRNDDCLASP